MSARPTVSPSEASAFLALLDAAKVHAPGCEIAFVRGFCIARSTDPIHPRPIPREEVVDAVERLHGFTYEEPFTRADPFSKEGIEGAVRRNTLESQTARDTEKPPSQIGRVEVVRHPPRKGE